MLQWKEHGALPLELGSSPSSASNQQHEHSYPPRRGILKTKKDKVPDSIPGTHRAHIGKLDYYFKIIEHVRKFGCVPNMLKRDYEKPKFQSVRKESTLNYFR